MFTRTSVLGAASLAVSALAVPAQAALFSFASDMNSNAHALVGSAGILGSFSINEASCHNTLLVDNNGPLPTRSIPIEFYAALTRSASQSTSTSLGLWLRSYRVAGRFGFYDAAGAALLTVPGTQTTRPSTGTVLGATSLSDITYTASAALITAMGGTAVAAHHGVFLGASGALADFAFDLSVLNDDTAIHFARSVSGSTSKLGSSRRASAAATAQSGCYRLSRTENVVL